MKNKITNVWVLNAFKQQKMARAVNDKGALNLKVAQKG